MLKKNVVKNNADCVLLVKEFRKTLTPLFACKLKISSHLAHRGQNRSKSCNLPVAISQ